MTKTFDARPVLNPCCEASPVDQAAHFPHLPPPPRGSRVVSPDVEPDVEVDPAGTANLPFAVPEPGENTELPRAAPRDALIGSLRETIRKIERAAPLARSSSGSIAKSGSNNIWQLGCPLECPEADSLLPEGLETDSLHEVKGAVPVSGAIAGAWMASLGFALRLAVRRLDGLREKQASSTAPWILWCWPRVLAGELGRPSAAGLTHLGLDPARILFVETARADEALVALEDGLKSQSLALAIGVFNEIDLTPARRLSLAAGEGRTPCLAITHPSSQPAGATATRWRIGWGPSAAHPFDAKAPGNARFRLQLERARARPQSINLNPLLLEWSDETHRFSVAASLADRAPQTRVLQSGARR